LLSRKVIIPRQIKVEIEQNKTKKTKTTKLPPQAPVGRGLIAAA
jgi:hypothetical protein